MKTTTRAISFIGGEVAGHGHTSLRIVGARIDAIDSSPQAGDIVVALDGDRVLPGLINAHDHLTLNVFPRIKFRDTHANVAEWIDDVDARRATDRRLGDAGAIARATRCWHGALKNLVSGVTTVAHHDPEYPELRAADFPVNVVRGYGWAHSLGIDGAKAVRASHHATPPDRPWFIHAGEGVDEDACDELARLDELGCLTPNARLIHGVGFGQAEFNRLDAAGAGLVWCPASNLFLFGRTPDVSSLAARGRVALGSDSRLSGSQDLLGELRAAYATRQLAPQSLELLVTGHAAALLGLPDRGVLRPGARSDLLILPAGLPLWRATRADLRAVIVGGALAWGDAERGAALLPAADRVPVDLDGAGKIVSRALAEGLARHGVREPGFSFVREAGWAA